MEDIQNILDKMQWLLWSALTKTEDAGLQAYVKSAIEHLHNASALIDANDNSLIAFLGRINVGKSTLMNALLGEKVAPVYNGDWSARPVEYRYSQDQSILLAEHYPPVEVPFHSQDELYDALRHLSTMDNPDGAIGHEQIVVKLDTEILKSGLILCDMPGFLACTGKEDDDIQGIHHADIESYLQQQPSVTAVFLVTNASLPEESVIQYVKENLSGITLHIVVNYRHAIETIEERKLELEKAWKTNLQRVLTFHYIDAKQSLMESTRERDDLITSLMNFATLDGRASMARETLVQAMDFVELKMKDFKRGKDPKEYFESTRIKAVHQMLRDFNDRKALETFERTWRL